MRRFRQALSPEGIVTALIGGGIWVVATAVVVSATKLSLGAAMAIGLGAGLVAAGLFHLVRRAPEARHRAEDHRRAEEQRTDPPR